MSFFVSFAGFLCVLIGIKLGKRGNRCERSGLLGNEVLFTARLSRNPGKVRETSRDRDKMRLTGTRGE